MNIPEKHIILSHPTGIVNATIDLPSSKSISNRLLIINKLSGNKATIENLSSSTDTQNLKNILESDEEVADVKDAGTSMRFLAAYYCAVNQPKIITGTERMCQRPIGELVAALRSIGFDIQYLKNNGFPPIRIIPIDRSNSSSSLVGGKMTIEIDAGISSQYVSALLMIAPLMPEGLTIILKNAPVSEPYINMTLRLMNYFDVTYTIVENMITIPHQSYSHKKSIVEKDWSAASYWYIVAALSKSATIFLRGLKENSMQGDKKIAEWAKNFGVETKFTSEGVGLTPGPSPKERGEEGTVTSLPINFINNPDLVQSILIMAAVKNIELELHGIDSLRIKETDRIAAMTTELKKINAQLIEKENGVFQLVPNFKIVSSAFETYKDHRMAMAFAPLALKDKIQITNPEVVDKSYPTFWEDLKKAGFQISSLNLE